uniref:receptor-like protein EIX2 isoform X2 n=1 Tax=Erigeron canadensis TaxID=72917 RepID=UPI001CB8C0F7|nr:receptor-like protein EIX2 isoform X2 [Erigeron canadensis]
MKHVLVILLLCMIFYMNGGVFTLGHKEDASMTLSGSCIEKEREALLIFKSHISFSGDSLDDWGDKEEKKDCCQWEGVNCNNHTGHVIKLDFRLMQLSGFISVSLGDLTSLTYLDLSSNNFTGNLPDTVWQLPNLDFLDVSDNSLNGNIPEFTLRSSLSHLDLSSNNFTGDLPSSVGQLLNLDHLDVSHNSLSGKIPEFTGCPSLSHLDLSSNNFTGDLPSSVGQLLNLDHLDVSHNSLSGKIPEFTGCPSLSVLDLDSNDFTGDIPISVTRLLNLHYLDFSHNSLSGNIPDFSGYPSISNLDLSDNKLAGNLPISVGQLSKLEHIDVSSNSLKGVISDLHFQNLTNLTYLDLSFNSFSLELSSIPSKLETIKLQSCILGPSFPMWLKNHTSFKYLDISSAGISQSIPSWFWDHLPSGLSFLNISSNELKDVLPDVTTDFDNYPGIDLSDNQFEGRVPMLPSKLAALNLSGNKFSGNLSFLCHIDRALTLLDLSNNSFTGSLPDCWSKFQEYLTILNLSNNNLSGKIPSSLGLLSHLQALYLRTNTFIGELPVSLSNCTKLRFVDLGDNKLSGTIPAWIGERLTESYVIVLRSNAFSGSLPEQVCWLYNLQLLDLSNNRLSGNIPECVGNLTAMVRVVGSGDVMVSHFYSSSARTLLVTEQALNPNKAICLQEFNCREAPIEALAKALFTDIALVAWKGKVREFGRTGLKLLKSIDLSSNNLSRILPTSITSLVDLVSLNLSCNNLHGEVPKDIGRLKSLDSLDLSGNEFSGSIPSSLSWIDGLGYLDLSNNNFSGKIPPPKLQLFDSSSYSGNPLLCGLPLTRKCGPDTGLIDKNEDDEEDDKLDENEVLKWYYIGMGVGFAVGFWGISGAIFLNRGCRHFLFAALSHVNNWIYVTLVLYLRKFKRF